MLSNVKSMVRTFYPIGQGAFYRERFVFEDQTTFNIIYDCGTETPKGKAYIKNIIRNWGEEPVDILFISHFHEDHISGIVELIKSLRIKLLIAPYLTAFDKDLIKIDILNRNSNIDDEVIDYNKISELFNVIDDYEFYFKNDVENIKFIAKEMIKRELNNNNVDVIDEGELSNIINNEEFKKAWIIDSFVSSTIDKYKIIDRFNEEFKNIRDVKTPSDIAEILRYSDSKRKLKSIYGNNIHKLCLVLYSGPSNNYIYQQNFRFCKIVNCLNRKFIECKNTKLAGCLYTGDYDAKDEKCFEELVKHFSKYRHKIGCFQVPHHGSQENFNDNFLRLNSFYIICAGKNNRYDHPGLETTHKLKCFNKPTYIITENSRKVEFNIDVN